MLSRTARVSGIGPFQTLIIAIVFAAPSGPASSRMTIRPILAPKAWEFRARSHNRHTERDLGSRVWAAFKAERIVGPLLCKPSEREATVYGPLLRDGLDGTRQPARLLRYLVPRCLGFNESCMRDDVKRRTGQSVGDLGVKCDTGKTRPLSLYGVCSIEDDFQVPIMKYLPERV